MRQQGRKENNMTSNCFKMRTFDCGGNHEIVLPNGKIVLVDPYFIDCKFENFTRDDVTGADYIILTHGHFDHDSDLGYLAKKFNAKVFCGVMTANELLIKYGAQLIFPFHFDVMIKKWGYEKVEAYMADVAKELHELDPGAAFVFPKALKWYSIDLGVTEE